MTLPLNRNKVTITGPAWAKKKILYPFEGEQLSVNEVQARVPALCADTVRRYLKRGINTKVGMLTVKPKRGRNGRGSAPRVRGSSCFE